MSRKIDAEKTVVSLTGGAFPQDGDAPQFPEVGGVTDGQVAAVTGAFAKFEVSDDEVRMAVADVENARATLSNFAGVVARAFDTITNVALPVLLRRRGVPPTGHDSARRDMLTSLFGVIKAPESDRAALVEDLISKFV